MSKLVLALVMCLLLAGCAEDRYEIDLQIRDQDTVRTMKARIARDWGSREIPFDDEVAPAKALYARLVESKPGQSLQLEGEFGLETPDDMGNSGRISRVRSNLGQVIVYTERFRGTHDLVGLSERQRSACNTFVNVVVAWAQQEFATKAGGPELIQAIDTDVRKDVQNLAMLGWFVSVMVTAGPRSDDRDAGNKLLEEYGARALSLLVEQRYIAPEESGHWKDLLTIESQVTRDGHLVLGAIGRRLAAEGKVASAALLKPTEALTKSFLGFAWDHPEVTAPWFEKYGPCTLRESRNAWEREYELPVACEQLLFESVGAPTTARDELALSVKYDGDCLSTNGIKKGPGTIEWTFTTERARNIGRSPPAVAMAVIASPDTKAQEALFGQVRVQGHDLAAYCTAFAALTFEQQTTWLGLLQAHHNDAEKLETELEQTDIHYRIQSQLMRGVRSENSTEE